MDLKSLQTFHKIVATGNFNRAATSLNYAQSTVTMQIQKLEAELGVQLFDRAQKTATLTEAGRLFHAQSVEIVKRIEQLATTMAEVAQGESGSVRIGISEPSASCRFPAILRKFLATHPKVRISVHIANTPVLSDWLRAGEIDVALCTTPAMGTGHLFDPLFQEEFVVLLPDDHPLVARDVVAPADFDGERLLITAANCPYRKKLEVMVQGWGITLNTLEIGSIVALSSFVEQGLGIALVPRILVSPPPHGTVVRNMAPASEVQMTTGLLYRVEQLPMQSASKILYQFLQQELANPAAPPPL